MKRIAVAALAFVLLVAGLVAAQTMPIPVGFATNIIAVPANFAMKVGGTIKLWIDGNNIVTASPYCYRWSSTSDASVSPDTGVCRQGAASVTVANGTTGPGSIQTAGTNNPLAIPLGAIGIATSATSTVGNTGQGGRLVVVCGPTAGTASLLFYAGTSNTPVTLANAVGGGLIGC